MQNRRQVAFHHRIVGGPPTVRGILRADEREATVVGNVLVAAESRIGADEPATLGGRGQWQHDPQSTSTP